MTEQQAARLAYPFQANEIEWRVLRATKDKTKGQVAAFVDSRAIQKRLDDVLGRGNWQNHFVSTQGKDNASTAHICEISIYYADRGEWITKSDGAGSTDIEPIKGGLSNAFKRAASMWNCGRYLYGLKNIWVALKDGKYIDDSEKPRLDKQYNQFVVNLLKSQGQQSTAKEAAPKQNVPQQKTPAAAAPTQARQQPAAPVTGRFAAQQAAPAQVQNAYWITDIKVTKGGSGAQTLVTLQRPDGQAVSGYIRGETPLKTGQSLRDLKITAKESPIAGKYNIIDSYQMAA